MGAAVLRSLAGPSRALRQVGGGAQALQPLGGGGVWEKMFDDLIKDRDNHLCGLTSRRRPAGAAPEKGASTRL